MGRDVEFVLGQGWDRVDEFLSLKSLLGAWVHGGGISVWARDSQVVGETLCRLLGHDLVGHVVIQEGT